MADLLDADLIRAAEILEREAQCLRDSHTLDDKWVRMDDLDRHAKAEHDEMRRLARRFRKVAGTL